MFLCDTLCYIKKVLKATDFRFQAICFIVSPFRKRREWKIFLFKFSSYFVFVNTLELEIVIKLKLNYYN